VSVRHLECEYCGEAFCVSVSVHLDGEPEPFECPNCWQGGWYEYDHASEGCVFVWNERGEA
jgi:hypothetical protein